MARVEVPLDELPTIASAEVRTEMVRAFKDLGFKFVTLDLEGFRSGSNNLVIPSENLMKGLVVPSAGR
jgi:uncharacterized protein